MDGGVVFINESYEISPGVCEKENRNCLSDLLNDVQRHRAAHIPQPPSGSPGATRTPDGLMLIGHNFSYMAQLGIQRRQAAPGMRDLTFREVQVVARCFLLVPR